MDKKRQQLPAAIGSKLMSQVERFASTTSRKATSVHPAVILENENRRNAVNIILGHRERSERSCRIIRTLFLDNWITLDELYHSIVTVKSKSGISEIISSLFSLFQCCLLFQGAWDGKEEEEEGGGGGICRSVRSC